MKEKLRKKQLNLNTFKGIPPPPTPAKEAIQHRKSKVL